MDRWADSDEYSGLNPPAAAVMASPPARQGESAAEYLWRSLKHLQSQKNTTVIFGIQSLELCTLAEFTFDI